VIEGKPDPEGYRMAAAALRWSIARCLVIEDAPAGVDAGRAAGAHVLGLTTTHVEEDLHAADATVADLSACRLETTCHGLVLAPGLIPVYLGGTDWQGSDTPTRTSRPRNRLGRPL
jgi:sugar-phosphatase